eukprot:gene16452-18775_t
MLWILLLTAPAVVLASVDLLVLGDWGGSPVKPYTMPGQVATAVGMGIIGDKLNAQAVLALGDNFYTYGIQGNDNSHRFADTWDTVYTADSLTRVPWYVIAGNHDYKGNVSAQIAYSQDNTRWKFPSIYHKQSFTSADGVTVDVLLIDTVDLAGNYIGAAGGESPEADAHYFDALPPRPRSAASEQWTWIEEQMQASTAQYLLVGGHYSLYSVCDHGNSQNLITNLQPLLQRYGAHYLSGHDHCMESMLHEGVHYIVSGMGDTCCYEASKLDTVPADSVLWYM